MKLARFINRSTRAETGADHAASSFAPELLLMLFLVFAPILAVHAFAAAGAVPERGGTAQLAGGNAARGG